MNNMIMTHQMPLKKEWKCNDYIEMKVPVKTHKTYIFYQLDVWYKVNCVRRGQGPSFHTVPEESANQD